MFNNYYGIFNYLGKSMGILDQNINWLGDARYALGSVSYTHLDVYKRQALVRSLTDKPLIVMIRTKAEGGELALMPDTYAAHCRALLALSLIHI